MRTVTWTLRMCSRDLAGTSRSKVNTRVFSLLLDRVSRPKADARYQERWLRRDLAIGVLQLVGQPV